MKLILGVLAIFLATSLSAVVLSETHHETVKKLFLIDKYHQEMKLADSRMDMSEMISRTNKLVDYCKHLRFTAEEIESIKKTTKIDPEEYRKDYIAWLELRQEALLAMTQLYIHETEGRASAEDEAKLKAKVKLWTDSEQAFSLKYHK